MTFLCHTKNNQSNFFLLTTQIECFDSVSPPCTISLDNCSSTDAILTGWWLHWSVKSWKFPSFQQKQHCHHDTQNPLFCLATLHPIIQFKVYGDQHLTYFHHIRVSKGYQARVPLCCFQQKLLEISFHNETFLFMLQYVFILILYAAAQVISNVSKVSFLSMWSVRFSTFGHRVPRQSWNFFWVWRTAQEQHLHLCVALS